MAHSKIVIERGDASLDEIRTVLSEVVEQMHRPGGDEAAAALEIDPALVRLRETDFLLTEQDAKFFGGEYLLEVGSGVTTAALIGFWTSLIWPRLRGRFGEKAAGKVR